MQQSHAVSYKLFFVVYNLSIVQGSKVAQIVQLCHHTFNLSCVAISVA